MSYPSYAIETAAHWLCRSRGQDPDEVIVLPSESAYAVITRGPRWKVAAKEIERYLQVRDSVRGLEDLE